MATTTIQRRQLSHRVPRPAPPSQGRNGRTRKHPRRLSVTCIYHASFASRSAERVLWGSDGPEIPVPGYSLLPEIASDSFTVSAQPVRLTAVEERTLFLRYNYAKHRLARLYAAAAGGVRSPREQELWRRRAESVREKLVHANLPLVPAMARRARTPGVEFSELLSEGYMTVLRCIEHFDVARGYKFSTYACRAILSCFRRLQSKATTYRKHVPMQFDPEMERDDYNERRHDDELDNAVDTVRLVLRQNRAELTGVERTILGSRHPLEGDDQRMTLRQVGKIVGLSEERVRQIERRSLSKLRDAIEEEMVA